jgi:hypothetical protein
VASDLYCSRGDVNERVPGGITFEGRLVESADASSDIFTLDGHGFDDDTIVYVRAASSGELPAGLSATTAYYVKRLTNGTFQLATSAGGAAVNFTTNGESVLVVREPPYDNAIEYVSRWADAFFPAHAVPFTAPIHPLVRGVVADITSKRLLNYDGKSSQIVDAAELAGKAILERFAASLEVLRPASGVTAPSYGERAVTTTASDEPDARGWTEAGTIP